MHHGLKCIFNELCSLALKMHKENRCCSLFEIYYDPNNWLVDVWKIAQMLPKFNSCSTHLGQSGSGFWVYTLQIKLLILLYYGVDNMEGIAHFEGDVLGK